MTKAPDLMPKALHAMAGYREKMTKRALGLQGCKRL